MCARERALVLVYVHVCVSCDPIMISESDRNRQLPSGTVRLTVWKFGRVRMQSGPPRPKRVGRLY